MIMVLCVVIVFVGITVFFFFFKRKTAYDMRIIDWSSDVCSSDLPAYIFPFVDPLAGTLLSFAVFALAFFARPLGSLIFMWVDRHHGRGTKLTIALFLLGVSTVSVAFLPSYADAGMATVVLLGLLRIGQGLALGGARSEEHTSALQSLMRISYAVFGLQKKK